MGILDFIEGNQDNKPKNAKKQAKKARQKQKKLAIRLEEEFDEDYDEDDEDDEDDDEDEDDDSPLAELRRRAPDVTITVVRPGQQPPGPRLTQSSQSLGGVSEGMSGGLPLGPGPAKLVPPLAPGAAPDLPSAHGQQQQRTILHPQR